MMQHYTLEHLLKGLEITKLNDMQSTMIAQFPVNSEVLLLSNTGSGKTLAFMLSILTLANKEVQGTQALIIAPSRELAMQIDEVFRKMNTGLKACLCYGGHKREIEENNLIEAPFLIIGTPGRLGDHLRRGNINTQHIHTLVLDEFDKSIELGFLEEINFIVSSLTQVTHKILCSATRAETLPAELKLNNPITLDFCSKDEDASNADLTSFVCTSPEKDKLNTLFQLLCMAKNHPAIVFCNHRDAIERIASDLFKRNIQCGCYHGGMEQHEREAELAMFRNGTSRVLITTDLGARGLDIPGIRYIIHYHLPLTEDSFTHRNGRTARMFDFGTSILLKGPEETLPPFVTGDLPEFQFPPVLETPEDSPWSTVHFSLGKKDKINKIDIVGFLSHVGELKKDDIGMIEVKDFFAFAAIRRKKAKIVLTNVFNQKIKNKKVRVTTMKPFIHE
jgi:ATP-independent RNA helicase DbpA